MGTQLPQRKGAQAQQPITFRPMSIVAHLSNCWVLVFLSQSILTMQLHVTQLQDNLDDSYCTNDKLFVKYSVRIAYGVCVWHLVRSFLLMAFVLLTLERNPAVVGYHSVQQPSRHTWHSKYMVCLEFRWVILNIFATLIPFTIMSRVSLIHFQDRLSQKMHFKYGRPCYAIKYCIIWLKCALYMVSVMC